MTLKYPILLSILCGGLFFVVLRQHRLKVVLKSKSQRTEEENRQIERGLRRSLFLEALIFAPVSIVLFRFTIFPLVYSELIQIHPDITVWYGIMGIIGYNFPFVILQELIIKIVKNVIKASKDTIMELNNANG